MGGSLNKDIYYEYFPDGKIKKKLYENKKSKQIIFIEYYDNSNIKIKKIFKNDIIQYYNRYYYNGKIKHYICYDTNICNLNNKIIEEKYTVEGMIYFKSYYVLNSASSDSDYKYDIYEEEYFPNGKLKELIKYKIYNKDTIDIINDTDDNMEFDDVPNVRNDTCGSNIKRINGIDVIIGDKYLSTEYKNFYTVNNLVPTRLALFIMRD